MSLSPTVRRLMLAAHLTCSVGWVGAVMAYLALAFAVPATGDPETTKAVWIGMDLVGRFALVPLAGSTLVTGIGLSLASPWGLFRHYWVVISLIATAVLTLVLVLHMPAVSDRADIARAATSKELAMFGSDVPHALIGLVLLLGILVLNVYKPRGLTRYGWRRQQAQRRPAPPDPRTSGELSPAEQVTPAEQSFGDSGA